MSKKKCDEPGIVAVLDQLGQREAEHVLVEAHGALDVAAHQGGVVQAASGGCRARAGGAQVGLADLLPARLELGGAGHGGVGRRHRFSCISWGGRSVLPMGVPCVARVRSPAMPSRVTGRGLG